MIAGRLTTAMYNYRKISQKKNRISVAPIVHLLNYVFMRGSIA